MKYFTFALNALLRIQHRMENSMKQEYSDMQVRAFEQKQQLATLEILWAKTAAQMPPGAGQAAKREYARTGAEPGENLMKKIAASSSKLWQYETELQAKRDNLIKARKEAGILEKIKARRCAAHYKRPQPAEEYFLNDIGQRTTQYLQRY